MTEPKLMYSELTDTIYIVYGRNKKDVTIKAINFVQYLLRKKGARTNYEKIIASLTPERMAEEIEKQGCATCPLSGMEDKFYYRADEFLKSRNCNPYKCHDSILDWLKQEAE